MSLTLNVGGNAERTDFSESRVINEKTGTADKTAVTFANGKRVDVADDVCPFARKVFALFGPIFDESLQGINVGKTSLTNVKRAHCCSFAGRPLGEQLRERTRKIAQLIGRDVAASQEIERLLIKVGERRAAETRRDIVGELDAQGRQYPGLFSRDHVEHSAHVGSGMFWHQRKNLLLCASVVHQIASEDFLLSATGELTNFVGEKCL